MMSLRSRLAPALAALLLTASVGRIGTAQAPTAAAAAGQPVVLLDGKSLDNWKPVGDPKMELLRDGSVANQRGKGVLYFAGRPFGNFTLELEYLPESAGAAAGVLLRIPPTPASLATLESAENSAYEVKLGEDPKPPAWREPVYYTRSMFITGAINLAGTTDSVHHLDQMSPNRPVSRALGEWNQLRVEAVGQRYTVYVNGEKVNDFFGRKATEGYIGLVNRTPEFSVRFRNIRVTPRTVAKAPNSINSIGELFAVRDRRAPIRVLLVTATHGFRHTYGIQGAIELMDELQKTTEFRVDTTENLANLNPTNLAKYDLLFFANSTLRIAPKDTTQAALRAVRLRAPIPNAVTPEQQRAVIEFVRSGKGVVLAHAALDASYGWDEYREMAGGGLFQSHPWTSHLRVKNEATSHAATSQFGDAFWIREEFYILDKSPRATSRVLLSLDNASLGSPNMGRLPAPENSDHPVSWVRTYGEGRVFATILGHFRDTWHRPEFVQHLLTGMRIAAGRLPADGAVGK
ncbi:MAG: ThuA domain-containing protein [Gemmatimonadaceae bacterium]